MAKLPNIEVKINGEAYPCRPTMGAMLRFKKETGKEVTELNASNFSDVCVYLYCCIASACAADKKPFNLSLMEFADAVSPEDMGEWAAAVQNENTETDKNTAGAEKKS